MSVRGKLVCVTKASAVCTLTSVDNAPYLVVSGLTDADVASVIAYANTDPLLARFTSDKKRFKDTESFDLWKEKGRVIYSLHNSAGELAGILWFGTEELPTRARSLAANGQFDTTFAIRLYGDARGKRLANRFMQACFADVLIRYPEYTAARYWLQTSEENIAAVQAFKKFGFAQLTQPDEKGKILMGLVSTEKTGS